MNDHPNRNNLFLYDEHPNRHQKFGHYFLFCDIIEILSW